MRICACSTETSMDGGDFHLRLNSIGESSSGASSPSSVSSTGTDAPRNAVRANRRRLRVRVQSLEGVVGAQRGRRMGRRNRTRAEREATADGDQSVRNARERQRVENLNRAYQQLRSELGETRGRRPTKLKTLEMAIQHIRELADELQRLRSEPQYAERPNGNYPTASEPSGQLDMAGGYPRMMLYVQESQSGQPRSSPSLSCDETMPEPIDDSNSEQDPMVHSTTSPIPDVPMYTSATPPPDGMYVHHRYSEQVSSTPSSSGPAVMLAGENSNLQYSPPLSTLPLQASPELFQPAVSLPFLPTSFTELTVGYPTMREEEVESSQHPWASCPPTLSHFDYPPIFQS